MEQRLIKIDEIQVGDEIIISCHSYLKYLKIIRLPIKKNSTTFKVSKCNDFEQDVEKHDKITYQDLYYRDIFLVKRETI